MPSSPDYPFDPDIYLEEFKACLETVEVTGRNPFNTEMFFLYCMVRHTKPQLFIESGTFRGYSASFICQALSRNGNNPEFITIGMNLEDCIPYARKRLERYTFARVVEGDSREVIRCMPRDDRTAAFFVDGPKGGNMYPLFLAMERTFTRKIFLAVHDCEIESTSGNREAVYRFFGGRYPILFCDSKFQEPYMELDRPLFGGVGDWKWTPFHVRGAKRQSYAVDTAYVLLEGSGRPPLRDPAGGDWMRRIRFGLLRGRV